jgi:hypothetical protein
MDEFCGCANKCASLTKNNLDVVCVLQTYSLKIIIKNDYRRILMSFIANAPQNRLPE